MMEDAIRGYVQCLLWANAYDKNWNPVQHAQKAYSLEDFSREDQAQIAQDVLTFIAANYADYTEYREALPWDSYADTAESSFGHDFMLTRCGHGTGFWDRGLGALGDRLTDASKPYGDTVVAIIDGKPVLTS